MALRAPGCRRSRSGVPAVTAAPSAPCTSLVMTLPFQVVLARRRQVDCRSPPSARHRQICTLRGVRGRIPVAGPPGSPRSLRTGCCCRFAVGAPRCRSGGVAVVTSPVAGLYPVMVRVLPQRRGHPCSAGSLPPPPVHHDGCHPLQVFTPSGALMGSPRHRGRLAAAVRPAGSCSRPRVASRSSSPSHPRPSPPGVRFIDGRPVIVVLGWSGFQSPCSIPVRIRQGAGEHFAAHPRPGQRALKSPSFGLRV